jgi:hypothetical protein
MPDPLGVLRNYTSDGDYAGSHGGDGFSSSS